MSAVKSKRGPQSAEARQRIIDANKRRAGQKKSEEHKRKLSEAQKGRPLTEAHRQSLSEAWKTRERKPVVERIYTDFNGYVAIYGREHPLTSASGLVYEHQVVLYEKIGPGPHACHWNCGKMLEWGGRNGIHVDHLDEDRSNNDPENLVPSCVGCNWGRSQRKTGRFA